jgi:5-methylcytosine-specific restriction protein B
VIPNASHLEDKSPSIDGANDYQTLREAFQFIMSRYLSAKNDNSMKKQIINVFRWINDWMKQTYLVRNRDSIQVDYGYGMGSMANVPWVALLDKRITSNTRDGTYCAYLFRADLSAVYLTIDQGVGRGVGGSTRKSIGKTLHTQAIALRPIFRDLDRYGFLLDDTIDLRDPGSTGQAYEEAAVVHKWAL